MNLEFRVWCPYTKYFMYTSQENWHHLLYGGADDSIAMEFQLPWQYKNNYKVNEDNWDIKNLIWQQYIKLKDKNDKKVFEGDILKRKNEILIIKSIQDFYFNESHEFNFMGGNEEWEIIGNIYENPELTKEII